MTQSSYLGEHQKNQYIQLNVRAVQILHTLCSPMPCAAIEKVWNVKNS